jgi:ribosomal protein S18 acetylase RimI-like enzyme
MRPDEAEAVVGMVADLALSIPAPLPKLTPQTLRDETAGANALLDCVVAEDATGLAGCCVTALIFSTWRNLRGIYISDIYVKPERRKDGLGQKLLEASIRRGAERGAKFVKLEADVGNGGAIAFYDRLGFTLKPDERLYILEAEATERLLSQVER